MSDDSWLLELSWRCRGTSLKNTGKVIQGRQLNQRNFIIPENEVQLVPRGYADAGSHFIGSMLSGISNSPKCATKFSKPFQTLYGDREYGYWCGKDTLTHDRQYNDECRMNVILNPEYLINVVNSTLKRLPSKNCV